MCMVVRAFGILALWALAASASAEREQVAIALGIQGNAAHLFSPGEPVSVHCDVRSALPEAPALLTWRLVDYRGRVLKRGARTIELKPNTALRETLTVRPGQFGPFALFVTVRQGASEAEAAASFGVLQPPRVEVVAAGSPFGAHFIPQEPDMGIAARLGVRWVRLHDMRNMFANWLYVEPERGHFVWDARGMPESLRTFWAREFPPASYDEQLNWYRAHGFEILGVIMRPPMWASSAPAEVQTKDPFRALTCYPPKPEVLPDFADFVARVVEHYKGVVRHYEIWNEPYGDFWASGGGTPESYAQLLKVAYQAIKRVDPKVTVLGGCVYPTVPTFTERLFKAGALESMDVLSFHHYFDWNVPSDFYREAVLQFQRLMGKYSKQLPVWNTETGVNSPSLLKGLRDRTAGEPQNISAQTISHDEAASMLVRDYVAELSAGVERIFYYWVAPDGERNINNLLGSGVIPKPKAFALAALMQRLEGTRPLGWKDKDPLKCCLFQRGTKQVAVCWAGYERNVDLKMRLRTATAQGPVIAFDLMGNRMGEFRGATTFPLTGEPFYLESSAPLGPYLVAAQVENALPSELARWLVLHEGKRPLILEGAQLLSRQSWQEAQGYFFSKGRQFLLCLHARIPEAVDGFYDAELAWPTKQLRAVDVLGRPLGVTERAGKSVVRVGASPVVMALAGVSKSEAVRFAQRIEWSSRFLVLEWTASREAKAGGLAPTGGCPSTAGEIGATIHEGQSLRWQMQRDLPGRWRIACRIRTGGDPMDWVNLYRITVDDRALKTRVKGTPTLTWVDPQGWKASMGWIETEEPVELRKGSLIRLQSDVNWAFVSRAVLYKEG